MLLFLNFEIIRYSFYLVAEQAENQAEQELVLDSKTKFIITGFERMAGSDSDYPVTMLFIDIDDLGCSMIHMGMNTVTRFYDSCPTIRSSVRGRLCNFWWGGAAILPHTNLARGLVFAKRIQASWQSCQN